MSNLLDQFISAYQDEFQYALDNRLMLNWYPKRIIEFTTSSNSLLELGIGHGYTTNLFSEYFQRHVVIDASASVIQQFREQHPNCSSEIIECFFEDFQTEEYFDLIVMGFVLEHVDDPNFLLNHFKQFLKPGGRCFIAVPNAECLHRRFGYEAGLLNDLMKLGKGDLELGHRRLYTQASLEEAVTTCGFRVIRKEGIFLKPLMTKQLQSLELDESILQAMCKVGVRYPELSAGLFFEVMIDG